MQERGGIDKTVWTSTLFLYRDDFVTIDFIVTILKLVENLTKALSSSSAWLGDVLPLFISTIDSIY